MKFYVTGRSSRIEEVQNAFNVITSAGHEITFEWTKLPYVKPYADHPNEARKFAEEGIQGVVDADVYIPPLPRMLASGKTLYTLGSNVRQTIPHQKTT